eukprot:4452844-Alexandrium_andersonii.AAC.1
MALGRLGHFLALRFGIDARRASQQWAGWELWTKKLSALGGVACFPRMSSIAGSSSWCSSVVGP